MKTQKGKRPKAAPKLQIYMDEITLDRDTPYGLFESDQGNRYPVTKNDEDKIAMILRHHAELAFTWQRLTKLKITTGRWLGDGEIELTHYCNDPRAAEAGTLGICDQFWLLLRRAEISPRALKLHRPIGMRSSAIIRFSARHTGDC